jgi:hypothetical protein
MLIAALILATALVTGQHHDMPGMHFDQSRAVHHFLIETDGGSIVIEAKNRNDDVTRAAVRAHLKMIADDFARGDFSSPFATHGEVPPGVREMQRLKGSLRYAFEETPDGGRVVIRSANKRAVTAVHRFLAYQIREHKTGDPVSGRLPADLG